MPENRQYGRAAISMITDSATTTGFRPETPAIELAIEGAHLGRSPCAQRNSESAAEGDSMNGLAIASISTLVFTVIAIAFISIQHHLDKKASKLSKGTSEDRMLAENLHDISHQMDSGKYLYRHL